MEYVVTAMISFALGFAVMFLATYLTLKARNKEKKEYNLPMADEYKPTINAVADERTSVDGQTARDNFKMG